MPETEQFIKDGYGWTCKRCREDEAAHAPDEAGTLARFFREGESEEREPRLSTGALARWRDDDGRRILFCPTCGAEEEPD